MTERPKFFDDLAGVAGGAFSALAGIREEAESMVRARVDEAIRKLDLVRREDLDAVQEMAANARAGQEAAESRLAALEARLSALEGAGPGGVAGGQPGDSPEEGASEVAPGTMPPGSDAPGSVMPPANPQPDADPSEGGGASQVAPGTMPPGSKAPGSTMPPSPDGLA